MTLLDLCRKAIGHVLDRAQTDPDFRYYMLHTESLALLIEAEAQLRGETIEETRWRRKDDHQPAHRWREPEIVVQRHRVEQLEHTVEQLERALEAAHVPVPEQRPRRPVISGTATEFRKLGTDPDWDSVWAEVPKVPEDPS